MARKPNKDRAAKVLRLVECTGTIGGLKMAPNANGEHLDIPGAAMMYNKGIVEVKRGEHSLELTSFAEALYKNRISAWAKPAEAEKAERHRAIKAAEKAAALREQSQQVIGLFEQVRLEAERAEQERERQQQERMEQVRLEQLEAEWANLTTNAQLVAAWEQARSVGNEYWVKSHPEVNMCLGLVRPGTPSKEAIIALSEEFGADTYRYIAEWCGATYEERLNLTMGECILLLASSEAGGLVSEWFNQGGLPKEELKPLEAYGTRVEWLQAIATFPGLSYEVKESLKGVLDKEVTT